jgi:drug/metabolite transporter (DMT)-like permease
MRFRDAVLAALTSVVWGLAFVATKLGLESFSAAELSALRFLFGRCRNRGAKIFEFWMRASGG